MDKSASFGVNTWRFWKLIDDSVLIESWAVIELRHPTRGEAQRFRDWIHVGEHTPT
jgi:hypothetical protein